MRPRSDTSRFVRSGSFADGATFHRASCLHEMVRAFEALGPGGSDERCETRGADGAVLVTGEHRIALSTHVSEVVDTIGAGDTFVAEIVYALIKIVDTADTARLDRADPLDVQSLSRVGSFAQPCAAITASRRGADLPWAPEVFIEP